MSSRRQKRGSYVRSGGNSSNEPCAAYFYGPSQIIQTTVQGFGVMAMDALSSNDVPWKTIQRKWNKIYGPLSNPTTVADLVTLHEHEMYRAFPGQGNKNNTLKTIYGMACTTCTRSSL